MESLRAMLAHARPEERCAMYYVAAVLLVLYLMRRRSRLGGDD